MDVPFRGMQRQHLLVYLASLEDPSPAAGVVSGVNMQMYAAFDMEEAGYLDFGEGQVTPRTKESAYGISCANTPDCSNLVPGFTLPGSVRTFWIQKILKQKRCGTTLGSNISYV